MNRYIYARNNPERIVDPNGNGWNPLSKIDTALTTTASEISKAVSSPRSQAIIFTAGVDVAAVAAIGLTGGTILATPAGGALVGAAIGATSYTLLSWSQANLLGAAEYAGVGAVSGALTYGVGEGTSAVQDLTTEGLDQYFPISEAKTVAQFEAEDAPLGSSGPVELTKDLVVLRQWGFLAQEEGRFGALNFNTPGELGLAAENSAEHLGLMTIREGSTVYFGPTGSGEAIQVYVAEGWVRFTQLW